MNGPEHYAEAERLLEIAREDVNIGSAEERYSVAAAAVHAQLAAVAAHINTKAAPEYPLAKAPDLNADLTWKDVIQ